MRKSKRFQVWAVIGNPMGDAAYPAEVWHLAASEAAASDWAETHELNRGAPVRVVCLVEVMLCNGKVLP